MKWEYKTIKIQPNSFFVGNTQSFESPEMDKFINQLGSESWELVSTQGIIDSGLGQNPFTTFIVLFFKRPLDS